jgi:hypothetical protein
MRSECPVRRSGGDQGRDTLSVPNGGNVRFARDGADYMARRCNGPFGVTGCGYTARGNGRSAWAPAAPNAGAEVVIETLIFPGGYRDQAGYEVITWRVEGSRRYKLPSLDFRTTIRGINLQGVDFDSLERVSSSPRRDVGEFAG